MNILETVLVYIIKSDQVLLIHKTKKDMNEGKYLGIGGKIKIGESIEDALIRETKEETNLDLLNYQHVGNVYFKNIDYEEKIYLFKSDAYKGNLKASNEGTLHWVDIKDIYKLPMWEGDKYFLSKLFSKVSFFEIVLVYENDVLVDTIEL
ncbi:8-oxo-dGTP diphosphatase [Acholeplasma oculi]|uniref:Mutator MutX protein n=1 Tax=Acholeplasma oculi TaxID=35623 RepID=A0A061AA80_9MOLU|nr:8-oxo-dGTP diphosphatase [Acholeplasma oculi]CDR30294.1 Mutator MutX protein [Acholeplasma oculi]SKC43286.1 8-oxo-dGTP diphosphatase [Acholeplasma oculi]SUT88739.1 8-oxo-dGTP diphosphatase [Acholeplasma oculi]